MKESNQVENTLNDAERLEKSNTKQYYKVLLYTLEDLKMQMDVILCV